MPFLERAIMGCFEMLGSDVQSSVGVAMRVVESVCDKLEELRHELKF